MITANAFEHVILTCFSPTREESLTQTAPSLGTLAPRFQNQVKGGLGRTPKVCESSLAEYLG